MTSARRTLLHRAAFVTLPAAVLAATATVGVLSAPTDAPSGSGSVRIAPVSFANGNPIGKMHFVRVPGGVRVAGWAFDPGKQHRHLRVVATVSGKVTKSVIAKKTNTKVARKYPKAGKTHGFNFTVPVHEGVRSVCVIAKDVGRGRDTRLGCLRRTTFDYGPYGELNSVTTRPGAIVVRGWLIDADRPSAAVTARVTVDGVAHDVVANARRTDVARAHAGAGSRHGLAATFPVAQGRHTVCVTSRNIGLGTDNHFACRSVTLNDNPVGELSLGQRAGKLRVAGFTFDRDAATTPLTVTIGVDNAAPRTITASSVRNTLAKKYGTSAAHGFDQRYAYAEGPHTVCVTVTNIGYGSDTSYGCRSVVLNYTPTARLLSVTPTVEGLAVRGWATDPDTSTAIPVRLTLDDKSVGTLTAGASGSTHSGHNFVASLPTRSGQHTVCAVAVNQVSGTHDSAPACRTMTLAQSPAGAFESLTRVGDNLRATGWAYDADTTAPVAVAITVDGGAAQTVPASQKRSDIAKKYPSAGSSRGFSPVLTTTDGEHTVCVTLRNVGGGADRSLGCKLVIAVHPTVTSAPRNARATSGYGALGVSWLAPANDGGAPPTSYRVIAGTRSATVPASALKATVTGLARKTAYRVTVSAKNAAGWSPAAVIAKATTQAGPAPQTSPAPVSTSRYMRNIHTCNASESNEMRSFGRSDALRNPAGHRYLQLLDIGGQSAQYNGVMLSAIVRFVGYSTLLKCTKSYVDGYASGMRSSAPATIALGVNNDLDVSAATGRVWATKIVNPVVGYARKYSGITIAGANDIEPGFSASYAATRNWVTGYLGATGAPFIFNGSADGCAWTTTGRHCNNGWTMAGLYNLAGGLNPQRIVNLPQVYNYTMADQWKYISLTGVVAKHPRINFGGPLTEAKACAQAGGCNSISGHSAWQRMWNNLRSHPALKVGSLPYATDLRIDS